MNKILIIEDDESIRTELSKLLSANNYQPVFSPPCDLALLDINLSGESGFSYCRKLRETSDIPVIFLTARDTPEDEILAFGVGADDFIRKPYHSSVLLARISRLLKNNKKQQYNVRGLILSIESMKATYNNESCELTKNETKILHCLMKKELCKKTEIVEELWNESIYIDESTLYVNIARLREKLSNIGAIDFIHTVRGVGYRL